MGLSQSDSFREHSKRKQQRRQSRLFGKYWFTPLQSSPPNRDRVHLAIITTMVMTIMNIITTANINNMIAIGITISITLSSTISITISITIIINIIYCQLLLVSLL